MNSLSSGMTDRRRTIFIPPRTPLDWTAIILAPLLVGAAMGFAGGSPSLLLILTGAACLSYFAGLRGDGWAVATVPAAGVIGWLVPVVLRSGLPGLGFDQVQSAAGLAALLGLAAEAGRQMGLKSAQAFKHATTDVLTGLLNQRGLMERLEAELNRCQRAQATLAVAFIDCDGFKKLNDFRGHLAGDRFLQTIAEQVKHTTRRYDSVARWGGDEFVILFPECDADAARVAITRLQAQLALRAVRENWPVTWSAGVAIVTPPAHPKFVLHAADQLMYEAKRTSPGTMVVREVSEAAITSAEASKSTATK